MKLKRLVSAIVAVGMMVAMLPVSVFADNEVISQIKYVKNLSFVGNQPVLTNATESSDRKLWTPNDTDSGWEWDNKVGTGFKLNIVAGYTFDASLIGNQTIPCQVRVMSSPNEPSATIINGNFEGTVYNFGNIKGGHFQTVSNTYAANIGSGNKYGKVTGGYIKNYLSNNAGTETDFDGGIVYGNFNLDDGKLTSGILCNIPTEYTGTYQTLTAENCTIVPVIDGENVPKDVVFNDHVYLVGNNVKTHTFEITADTKSVDWVYDKNLQVTERGNKLTVTIPTGSVSSNDVIIKAIRKKTPLQIVNGCPADNYTGSEFDGWKYIPETNTMTFYKGYTADLDNLEVDWTVENSGVVKNATFQGDFINNGEIISGVFSRYAKFGAQNPSVRWVTVNGGTVNGMTTAGVVGEQEVTITAPDGFKCWSVAGDTDFTLTEEQKHSNPLTLKLNGEDKGTIILTAQSEEGYYPLNLTDGKAYSVTADGAKEKEITAARAGDTVILEADATLIPDGMVFDRWEITGDTELTGGFDANAEKTQFTMPNASVTIRAMYRMADVEEPNVLGPVAVVATAGVGAAVLGWTGYNIAADLYAQSILPEGTAIPETKEALAVMLWQNAGKPEVVAADGSALTETEQAQQWVVANGLMENEADGTFHPEKGVGKFAALNAIKEQNEAKVNE